jgi:FkbM family methyltransferase
MKSKKQIIKMFNILRYSQTTGSRGGVYWRFFTWQLFEKHFAKNGHVKNWIGGRKLLVVPGRTSSTGNYYFGLMEYPEMSFLLDYADNNDVFVDIGANVGVYSVLLGKICKRGYAFEPSKSTYSICKKNLNINNIRTVKLRCLGIGETEKEVEFTKGLDSVNHIVQDNENSSAFEVEHIHVVSLDDFLKNEQQVSIIKIDVEGGEMSVLKGAEKLLKSDKLNVLIMEIFDNKELVDIMEKYGFQLYRYNADKHILNKSQISKVGDNGIFIKNIMKVKERGIGLE